MCDCNKWLPIETAPRDGTEIIAWMTTDKGFGDITANIFWKDHGYGWVWANSYDHAGYNAIVKRPDLIRGWKLYPAPPQASEGDTDVRN